MNDALKFTAAILAVGVIWYVPRRISSRRRLCLGVALFIVGWAGVLTGLHFGDEPFLQSEAIAYAWMGSFSAALVLSVVFLVTAGFDWLGLTRPRRQRKQFPPHKP